MHRRPHVAEAERRRLPGVEGVHLLGSVPVTHVDDVCHALVFYMERPAMAGRFLCAAATRRSTRHEGDSAGMRKRRGKEQCERERLRVFIRTLAYLPIVKR
jgi:hypothetical protein